MADYLAGLGGLADLYGQYQSYQNANTAANNVNNISGAASSAWNNQLQSLQNQSLNNIAARNDMVAQAREMANVSYGRLGDNIMDMQGQITALHDPNSAYMQNARAAIERKDAAAGRRSQWGDREVQLQGALAENYGKYAPGLQNAITGAHNQLSTNYQALGSLWNNMNNGINNTNTNLTSLINEGGKNQAQLAQTAMGLANNANNQQNGLVGGLLGAVPGVVKGLGSIWDMFGGGGGSSDALGDFGSSEGWW